jgi:hypothetical protein
MHYNQILSIQFHFKLKNACKNQQCSLKIQFFFFHTKKKITLIHTINTYSINLQKKTNLISNSIVLIFTLHY